MIDMLKRHEIQVLRRAGHTQTEIAKLAGVSRRSEEVQQSRTPCESRDLGRTIAGMSGVRPRGSREGPFSGTPSLPATDPALNAGRALG